MAEKKTTKKAEEKEPELTYVDLEGKNLARLCEAVLMFEKALRSYAPLPIEWLLLSLEQGGPLAQEDYVQKDG